MKIRENRSGHILRRDGMPRQLMLLRIWTWKGRGEEEDRKSGRLRSRRAIWKWLECAKGMRMTEIKYRRLGQGWPTLKWLGRVGEAEGKDRSRLSHIFCIAHRLLINLRFLSHCILLHTNTIRCMEFAITRARIDLINVKPL